MDIREGLTKYLYTSDCGYGVTADWDTIEWDVRMEYEGYVDGIISYLKSEGIVRKGQSLGATHPHLAAYFTVEEL